MKKNYLAFGIYGFALGVALNQLIVLLIGFSTGYYLPCPEELSLLMGSELSGATLQFILSGILGCGFAYASLIWKIESWSLLKQTVIYFIVICLIFLPIGYLNYWMPHSISGFLTFFFIFFIIFLFVWLIQYWTMRYKIRKMNEKINSNK